MTEEELLRVWYKFDTVSVLIHSTRKDGVGFGTCTNHRLVFRGPKASEYFYKIREIRPRYLQTDISHVKHGQHPLAYTTNYKGERIFLRMALDYNLLISKEFGFVVGVHFNQRKQKLTLNLMNEGDADKFLLLI